MLLVLMAATALTGAQQTNAPPRREPPPPPPREQAARPSREVYFRNCSEARAAGRRNIRRGEPGYRPALDRDNDGVACEAR
jgi:micrococcal nuclease